MNDLPGWRLTRGLKTAPKVFVWAVGAVVPLGVSAVVAFPMSSWPSPLLVRCALEKQASAMSLAHEKHVPSRISAHRNQGLPRRG